MKPVSQAAVPGTQPARGRPMAFNLSCRAFASRAVVDARGHVKVPCNRTVDTYTSRGKGPVIFTLAKARAVPGFGSPMSASGGGFNRSTQHIRRTSQLAF